METFSGKSVLKGIAIAKIQVYSTEKQVVKRLKVEDVDAEIARVDAAVEEAQKRIQALYDKAVEDIGEEQAAIFEVHQMMLEDEDYQDSIHNIISTESVNAEYAVARTSEIFEEMFNAMDDEYMKARAADIKDISERLLSVLAGEDFESGVDGDQPVILLADDLSPSETVQLDKSKIAAFVTRHGSLTSHTAILARTMNIPALIGVKVPKDMSALNGKTAIVDGSSALFYIDPDQELLDAKMAEMKTEQEQKKLLQQLKGVETVTKSGHHVNLYANVGNIEDIGLAQQNDAEGIGLFRSEFIYLKAEDYPTEQEQFQIYQKALQLMGGKRVIIRTCDIGADKQVDYFDMEHEDNPALGYRAIRICLDRRDFFKTQLRALFRASVFGRLAIMYPMIISLQEVKTIQEIVEEVKKELEEEGIPYSPNVEQGIMIETPAAALISDQLAKEVDFFSVGTNDLTQYTLAIDRQNPRLEEICDTHHEAILKLIRMAADSAHAEGKWIGICGELGADLELTEQFMDMGIDELSVSPGMILKVRDKVRNC